jgi:hypothetical protein
VICLFVFSSHFLVFRSHPYATAAHQLFTTDSSFKRIAYSPATNSIYQDLADATHPLGKIYLLHPQHEGPVGTRALPQTCRTHRDHRHNDFDCNKASRSRGLQRPLECSQQTGNLTQRRPNAKGCNQWVGGGWDAPCQKAVAGEFEYCESMKHTEPQFASRPFGVASSVPRPHLLYTYAVYASACSCGSKRYAH